MSFGNSLRYVRLWTTENNAFCRIIVIIVIKRAVLFLSGNFSHPDKKQPVPDNCEYYIFYDIILL